MAVTNAFDIYGRRTNLAFSAGSQLSTIGHSYDGASRLQAVRAGANAVGCSYLKKWAQVLSCGQIGIGRRVVGWFYWLMACPLRIERSGERYHATARGNERQPVFRDETDRFHFLELLNQLGELFSVRIHAYVHLNPVRVAGLGLDKAARAAALFNRRIRGTRGKRNSRGPSTPVTPSKAPSPFRVIRVFRG